MNSKNNTNTLQFKGGYNSAHFKKPEIVLVIVK